MSGGIAARLVVKVGTSTLTDSEGRIDRGYIADLTSQLAAQRARGCEVILVTSGAIRAGKEVLAARRPSTGARIVRPASGSLPYKQAAAAIGQGLLIRTYTEAFAWRDVDCAQVLLTRDDLDDRRRFLNARHTLTALLALGVVPIINENDTVAVDEIKFGDNDNLAAQVATLVEADLLLILSDVEGLYTRRPDENADLESVAPEVIQTVPQIDATILAIAGGSESGVGTGGMATKVEAARIATLAGIRTVIAMGRREHVVADVVDGAPVGTTFLPCADGDRMSARKGWIAHSARVHGSLTVDAKAAARLLQSGVSLLAVGIVEVDGDFAAGDVVEVRDQGGRAFARGLTNYGSSEVRRIRGLHSAQFEAELGHPGFEEVIHRDNLVVDSGLS